jgi:hypothetical protein
MELKEGEYFYKGKGRVVGVLNLVRVAEEVSCSKLVYFSI